MNKIVFIKKIKDSYNSKKKISNYNKLKNKINIFNKFKMIYNRKQVKIKNKLIIIILPTIKI